MLWIVFEVDKVTMRHIQSIQVDEIIDYVQEQMNKYDV